MVKWVVQSKGSPAKFRVYPREMQVHEGHDPQQFESCHFYLMLNKGMLNKGILSGQAKSEGKKCLEKGEASSQPLEEVAQETVLPISQVLINYSH